MKVAELEALLLREFPRQQAEEWDYTGLRVGDPNANITKVAIALDPTVAAIKCAHERGANVLVTHHPLFIEVPDTFLPAPTPALANGAAVYAAITYGVAVMNFHTALDVSIQAQTMLPGLLGLTFDHVVEPISSNPNLGYGQFCVVNEALTVGELAKHCDEVFCSRCRVWGNPAAQLHSVVTCTGSAAGTCDLAMRAGAGALVCGEIKYHAALNASNAGLAIIDLGHDISEYPFTTVLKQVIAQFEVASSDILVLERDDNWH